MDAKTSQSDATAGDRLFAAFQHLLPQRFLSGIMYRLTRSRSVWWKNALISWFVKRFQVDMSTANRAEPTSYGSFNSFFTRSLKVDARPICEDPQAIACPVDGAVSQCGLIDGTTIFQAKGRSFDLVTLLGGDAERARPFEGGHFATIYLSPRDYHRIHMPLAGSLLEMVHIPGKLFSVNPATARAVDGLFARNERVAAIFETPAGPMAMVLVGAIFVGSMETVWSGVVTPPYGRQIRNWQYGSSKPTYLEKGQEMGRFNMGSTVVLLFGPEVARWAQGFEAEAPVKMGEAIGAWQKDD